MAVDFDDLSTLVVAKVKCLKSTEYFFRFFFKQQYGKKAIIGDHHKKICYALDRVFKGECKRLIINIAPRYGKTELAVKSFIARGLALNPSAKFIHLSYSDKLALDNSETVKEIVKLPIYQRMFPDVTIKKGTDAKEKWYTDAGGGLYAAAAGGQITGFGAGLVDEEQGSDIPEDFYEYYKWLGGQDEFGGAIIIDDPIKPEDAQYETKRQAVNDRYDSTIVNRVNSRNTPIIIIMQRVHEDDLCGHVMEHYKDFEVLSLPVINKDGSALWPHKHTVYELQELRQANEFIFDTQMMQDPRPKHGLLFPKDELRHFIPNDKMEFEASLGYIDVADEGEDYCSMPIGKLIGSDIFIPDCVFDDSENMQMPCASKIHAHKLEYVRVESNNGGNFFTMQLVELCPNTHIMGSRASTNKLTRIRAAAGFIKKHFVFVDPKHQSQEYKKFYENLTKFTKNGKGIKNDDAPDSCAGLAKFVKQYFPHLFEGLIDFQ